MGLRARVTTSVGMGKKEGTLALVLDLDKSLSLIGPRTCRGPRMASAVAIRPQLSRVWSLRSRRMDYGSLLGPEWAQYMSLPSIRMRDSLISGATWTAWYGT